MDNYQELAMVTNTDAEGYHKIIDRVDVRTMNLLHAHLGLSSEVGEIGDAIKKHVIYGQELDLDNLKEEAGDVCWYLALLLSHVGSSFDEIMELNIAKLKKRYPAGFTEHAAKERLDKADKGYPVYTEQSNLEGVEI